MKTEESDRPHPLPESFRPLFWEYDFHSLSWENDMDLVLARILQNGRWEDIKTLRSRIGDGVLRSWIIGRKGRPLSPPRLRFWELILELPSGQVDRWLSAKARKVWDGRAAS